MQQHLLCTVGKIGFKKAASLKQKVLFNEQIISESENRLVMYVQKGAKYMAFFLIQKNH